MLDRDMLADVKASGRVTADHARALRASIYKDGVADPSEVERLFAIDEAAREHDPAWCEFFVEAITDLIVEQMEPPGYISEANADWLIARIGADGVVGTATELELLVKVLEKAKSSPERLSAFALDQVKAAVLDGEGPLARGEPLERGRVTRAEADLIRRILYAFGGEANVAVTRREAEILFDINDASADAPNDPAWSDLFVKAIANFLMAASGYAVPSREAAIRREDWLDSPSGGVADFFSRAAAGGLRGILQAYRDPAQDAWVERNRSLEALSRESEAITADEAEWLAHRIGRDGALHANEKALLRFIRDEAGSVHPSLRPLIEQAA